MRKLRTIHTMDVRGRFVLRHSSQICPSFSVPEHTEAHGGVVMMTTPFLFARTSFPSTPGSSSNGWKPSSLFRKGAHAHIGPQRGI